MSADIDATPDICLLLIQQKLRIVQYRTDTEVFFYTAYYPGGNNRSYTLQLMLIKSRYFYGALSWYRVSTREDYTVQKPCVKRAIKTFRHRRRFDRHRQSL